MAKLESVRLLDYLSCVVEVTNKKGWVSRRGSTYATADMALDLLTEGALEDTSRPSGDSLECHYAQMALEWVRSVEIGEGDFGDYLEKLQTACGHDTVPESKLGLVASLIPTFRKQQVNELKKAMLTSELGKQSSFVGDRGDTIETTLIVKQIVPAGTRYYGGEPKVRTLYMFEDPDGNILTWKTADRALSPGDRLVIRGKVRAHDLLGERIPSTVLSHVRVFE